MIVRIIKINVTFAFSMVLALLSGCASLTEAECDPSDEAFLKTFRCQGQYANRAESLREEVRIAGEQSRQKEMELADLESRRSALQLELDQLQIKLDSNLQRIERLRKENKASDDQLASLSGKLDTVQKEAKKLNERQSQMQVMSEASELDEQIAQLKAEEAELEALLLDLES